jgi:hypothetical protein
VAKDKIDTGTDESADVTQMRAELAMLRNMVKDELDRRAAKESDLAEKARYLEWVGKTTEEKTQIAADRKFAGLPGHKWEVQLPEHPKVIVPGNSDYEAIGRYNDICGITQTEHKHTCIQVAA